MLQTLRFNGEQETQNTSDGTYLTLCHIIVNCAFIYSFNKLLLSAY